MFILKLKPRTSIESGLSLFVALLEGEVDGGPPPADLLGHLDDGVVGKLRLDLHKDLYFIIILQGDPSPPVD